MTHPLIPEIIDLAKPIAKKIGLEVVEINFQTNENPPILTVKIRNIEGDTSLNNCEQMSQLLEENLDSQEIIPFTYMLEVSSQGISKELITERDFITFKGFPVVVKTNTPYKNKQEWRGSLQGKNQESVSISQKGKIIKIPIELVTQVEFDEQN